MKALYTAHATSTGGRDGKASTDDGQVSVTLAIPKAMGGSGKGTNPEQLFATGYSACFLSAINFVARKAGKTVSADSTVSAAVGIGEIPGGFGLEVELTVTLPGLSHAEAVELVETAHKVCPYSNATRNNVEVKLTVV